MSNSGLGRMDRRALLVGGAAALATPASARLGAAQDAAVFEALILAVGGTSAASGILIDACVRHFEGRFGATARDRLVERARRRPTLAALLRDADARTTDQIGWIATFLYTGETEEGAIYHPWCLGWAALGFATAPGACGGAFGHWARAPQ